MIVVACSTSTDSTLFTLLPSEQTGITFENTVIEQEGFNVLEYEYFYNGAGVAAGDINNDGLPDLYFSANMNPDRLYLNKGDLIFEDISATAGFKHSPTWTTGVTMVDINDDGWLDIYVCRSGNVTPDRRRNALYINNGNLTFTERAAEYGLDQTAYSNHAAFFDYDRDGDLDVFLLNHSIRRYSQFVVDYMRNQRDSLAGDRLLRNDDSWFTDVSEEAGIIGNPLGFGLASIVGDVNQDGWLDLYVSNDYIEDDYLYINQKDGTFRESSRLFLSHTSYSSMGADIADINNDALPDIVTLDMMAEDNYRQKILKGPEDYEYYAQMRENGFHEQYMRNMLQLRQGDDFIEIGRMAGIATTDWSWAALLADFDLDGYKDLLVTNGYLRDYTNLDFLRKTLLDAYQEASRRGQTLSSQDMVQHMPSTRLKNYIFRNKADLTFADHTALWGLEEPTHSNGAAITDLDADGDLDIVINNVNQEAFVYRNNAETLLPNHFLRVVLEGPAGNRGGIGTKVIIAGEGQHFYQELIPGRGYLSSVEPILVFGLGALEQADITVRWPDGQSQFFTGVSVNRTLTVKHSDATDSASISHDAPSDPLFAHVAPQGLTFQHQENVFVDYDRESLLPHMLSKEGPAIATGDINKDALEDIFVGGARGQEGKLFLQQADGSFLPVMSPALAEHIHHEDTDALFFDTDGDHDLDLYVISGGTSEQEGSSAYQDRLYVNEGFGRFVYSPDAIATITTPGSAIAPHDFDGDGDTDLFVGGRARPGSYPLSPRSYLLENEGGVFRDVTSQRAAALVHPGMVTDALWADLTGDGTAELVLTGEWMPIRVFENANEAIFTEITASMGLDGTNGFWNALAASDLDADGDIDLVAGNRGINTQLKATPAEPVSLYAADIDNNGSIDPLMSTFIQGAEYPVYWRDKLLSQIPSFALRFPTYASYADATMQQILEPQERAEALRLQVFTTETSLFENNGSGKMHRVALPLAVQVAPVRDILVVDFNRDGHQDLLMAGNNFGIRAEVGRDDAGRGSFLTGNGDLSFQPVMYSGFYAAGDVRRLSLLQTPNATLIVVATNNEGLTLFTLAR